jgi:hypothetical protein
MAEARLLKFRFKPGGKKKWLEWSEEMKRRSREVLETLRNEGVIAEACFLSPEEDAVYYFVGAEDLERGEKAFSVSPYPIDREHMQVKSAALQQIAGLKCLFFFDNR